MRWFRWLSLSRGCSDEEEHPGNGVLFSFLVVKGGGLEASPGSRDLFPFNHFGDGVAKFAFTVNQ
ncbi:hypothetical protein [Allomesorhizobium camelthorni]|uniref:Uncharacterized protein n=1 Tax=Allomesorhizobium camelthorni TaxID=475069 RepID=A0A6G4W776_9HYPH|nr:hypothetical protein [Mesorhizobium camelthorni]NGO50404.1 hypothetical protein [Mesorhizobium camelthorni]